MHIVVIDEDGSASGIPGNILEKHLYLSKAKDGKRQPAEEVYYKNYLANKSELQQKQETLVLMTLTW